MGNKVNTIIIGAGFSGLSAGIRLAQFQESVLILEAHTVPGGLNSYYFRGGKDKVFSSGLHTVTNFNAQNRKWGFGLICRNLGLEPEAFQLYPPKYPSKIISPDHELIFDNDLDVIRQSIAQNFPLESDPFERFLDFIKKLKPEEKWFQLKPKAVLADYFKDPALIGLLEMPVYIYGGYAEGEIDFMTFATVFRSIFIEGCGSPPHIKHILDLLVGRFKALGGQIKYRKRVKRLLTEGGKFRGIELESGEVIEADYCLSSIGLEETGVLVGQQWGDSCDISAFETLVNMPQPLSEYGVENTLFMVSRQRDFSWEVPADLHAYNHLTLSALDNYDFDFEPPLHQLKIGCYQSGKQWQALSEPDYEREKARMEEAMLAELKALFPALDVAQATYAESLTPQTVTRYTSHLNGAIYGGRQKTFDGQTAIENLFIVGNDQGGIGIMGTLTSGIVVSNYQVILKK